MQSIDPQLQLSSISTCNDVEPQDLHLDLRRWFQTDAQPALRCVDDRQHLTYELLQAQIREAHSPGTSLVVGWYLTVGTIDSLPVPPPCHICSRSSQELILVVSQGCILLSQGSIVLAQDCCTTRIEACATRVGSCAMKINSCATRSASCGAGVDCCGIIKN